MQRVTFVAWIALVSMIRRRPPVTLFDGCVDYWTLEEHKETVDVNDETRQQHGSLHQNKYIAV